MKNILLLLGLLLFVPIVMAASWPADSTGTQIGNNLPSGYEPSGIVWAPYYNSLVVVSDGGLVSKMDQNGNNVTNCYPGGDLEGVTIVDSSSKYVYLAVEYEDAIIKYDLSTCKLIKSVSIYNLLPATPSNNNSRVEGIAYIPNKYLPTGYSGSTGGLFAIAFQNNGVIYFLDVDFNAGTATSKGSFTPVLGRTDSSDLYFSTETETLYVLYDGANALTEVKMDGTVTDYTNIPDSDQEGITLLPSYPSPTATIIIAQDSGGVMKHFNYPVAYPAAEPVDADGDGYDVDSDCNDNNAEINPGATEVLYDGVDNDCNAATLDTVDNDGDGYNSNVDCNDNDATVNPGKTEVAGNGKDDDCNAETSDYLPSGQTILEAESMILSRRAVLLSDSVAFYQNSYVYDYIDFESGTYQITIYARADTVTGRVANMRVMIDNRVVGNYAVTSSDFTPITLSKTLSQGEHKVRVMFTNDYFRSSKDVNLYVDKLIFEKQ